MAEGRRAGRELTLNCPRAAHREFTARFVGGDVRDRGYDLTATAPLVNERS